MRRADRPTQDQVDDALTSADIAVGPSMPTLAAEVRALRAQIERRDVVMTALGELCPCSYDPDGPGPLQECPVDGDGAMFVSEVRHLRLIEALARAFIASEDRGPFASAVAVRDLRAALNGPTS